MQYLSLRKKYVTQTILSLRHVYFTIFQFLGRYQTTFASVLSNENVFFGRSGVSKKHVRVFEKELS